MTALDRVVLARSVAAVEALATERPDLLAAQLRDDPVAVDEAKAWLLAEAGVTRRQWLGTFAALLTDAGIPLPPALQAALREAE